MFDRQEFFNKGVLGIINQGGFATNGLSCKYRAENGNKCFLGHNIPDEQYEKAFEGRIPYLHGFNEYENRLAEIIGIETKQDLNLVRECQKHLHDNLSYMEDGDTFVSKPFNREEYIEKCEKFAEKFHLIMPEIK